MTENRSTQQLGLDTLGQKVYDLLVNHGGASDDESNRIQFDRFWRERGNYREYRFIGFLGFGGKFWSRPGGGGWRVDCYAEDETPERVKIMATTNRELQRLETQEGGRV